MNRSLLFFLLFSLCFLPLLKISGTEDVDCCHVGRSESVWARVDVGLRLSDESKPTVDIETIQPLFRANPHTLFIQGRIARKNQDETYNIGFGYRSLFCNEKWLFGGNLFFDATQKRHHYRLGVGFEAFSEYCNLRVNLYDARRGRVRTDYTDGVLTSERTVAGYDASVESRMPFLPWMSVTGEGFHWRGHSLDSVYGYTVSTRMHINDFISIELGHTKDNYFTDNFATLRLRVGRPCRVEHTLWDAVNGRRACCAFVPSSLPNLTLEKARRYHSMMIERRHVGGAGIVVGRG